MSTAIPIHAMLKLPRLLHLSFVGSVCGAHHNAAIEEAAQALEALQTNNTDVPEEYFTGSRKQKF
jgi:hypothetical protein